MAKKKSTSRRAPQPAAKKKKGVAKKAPSRRPLLTYPKGRALVAEGVWTEEELKRNMEAGVVGRPRSFARFAHSDPRVHRQLIELNKLIERAAQDPLFVHFGVLPKLTVVSVEGNPKVKIPALEKAEANLIADEVDEEELLEEDEEVEEEDEDEEWEEDEEEDDEFEEDDD